MVRQRRDMLDQPVTVAGLDPAIVEIGAAPEYLARTRSGLAGHLLDRRDRRVICSGDRQRTKCGGRPSVHFGNDEVRGVPPGALPRRRELFDEIENLRFRLRQRDVEPAARAMAALRRQDVGGDKAYVLGACGPDRGCHYGPIRITRSSTRRGIPPRSWP